MRRRRTPLRGQRMPETPFSGKRSQPVAAPAPIPPPFRPSRRVEDGFDLRIRWSQRKPHHRVVPLRHLEARLGAQAPPLEFFVDEPLDALSPPLGTEQSEKLPYRHSDVFPGPSPLGDFPQLSAVDPPGVDHNGGSPPDCSGRRGVTSAQLSCCASPISGLRCGGAGIRWIVWCPPLTADAPQG